MIFSQRQTHQFATNKSAATLGRLKINNSRQETGFIFVIQVKDVFIPGNTSFTLLFLGIVVFATISNWKSLEP